MSEETMKQASVIPYNGKTYYLAPFTEDMIFMFQHWLEARAWDSVERHRHGTDAETYERRLEVCGYHFSRIANHRCPSKRCSRS